MAHPLQNLGDRVLRHSIPEPNSGCWLWMGTAYRAPIQMRPFLRVNGRDRGAHRISYEAFKGPIPKGLCACHTCHNSLCVNPDHLYAGTKKQTTDDMMRAGRHFSQSGPEAITTLTARIAKVNEVRRNKPACIRGHLLQGDNLRVNLTTGQRRCMTCHRAWRRDYYIRKGK